MVMIPGLLALIYKANANKILKFQAKPTVLGCFSE
jgi:hypothetical protein